MPRPPSNGLGSGPVPMGTLGLDVDDGSDPVVVDGVSSGLTRLGCAVSVSSTAAAAVDAKLGRSNDEDGEGGSEPEGSSFRFSSVP